MEYVEVIIKKDCAGSEDGIHVKIYKAAAAPQPVEKKLAGIFVKQGWATIPDVGNPAERQTKVVVPEVKVVAPEERKSAAVKKQKPQ